MRAAGLAALIGLLAGIAPAPAQAFDRFGSIAVDVRPLQAYARGPQTEALRVDLTEALRRSFADRMVRGGPTLVVRVSGLSLNPYVGGEGFGRGGSLGGGGTTDHLDGEALLVGRGGEILARHPQLSALPASSGGAWYDPASERRRVAALAEHYAQWLRRQLPAQ
ncbi:hypothetical protein MPPM_1133 [Methylorubrum populi]|uniref:DUF3016 domain-containing protein n=1 Tax=Methylorubrum populi TaxID=223967 RepID=A0A161JKF5_9HYPH|nr:hypothetical protein [Methylorubrum populi]BAU89738.1 hypothetical protein MPPM_1133 [Methylorubrum populi]